MPRTETLTSRQRVCRALRHETLDRMPLDLGAHYSTGISAFAYQNLREHLGLPARNIEICDMSQFLARVDLDVLERFHCDCILLNPGWAQTHPWRPRGKFEFQVPTTAQPAQDETGEWQISRGGRSMRMPAGGFFFDGDSPNLSDRPAEEHLEATTRMAERIFKETQFATLYIGFGGYFSHEADSLCRMVTDPDDFRAQNERNCAADIERAGQVIDRLGRYVQLICLNADLGSQKGPLCRPALYEQLCAPYLKRLCAFIHAHSDCKTFYHCCGSVKPFLPMLLDAGVDAFNPVQIGAKDMDPAELKSRFGDKLTFWGGGCDTQKVLARQTPAAVAANVRELARIFKPGGGFVFNQVHNIMGDVPPENIVAMLDTAYEESWY